MLYLVPGHNFIHTCFQKLFQFYPKGIAYLWALNWRSGSQQFKSSCGHLPQCPGAHGLQVQLLYPWGLLRCSKRFGYPKLPNKEEEEEDEERVSFRPNLPNDSQQYTSPQIVYFVSISITHKILSKYNLLPSFQASPPAQTPKSLYSA